MVKLQLDQHVTVYHKIWRRIEKRLDTWDAGWNRMLLEEKLQTYEKCLATTRR